MAAFFGFADPGRLFGFPGFADAGRLAPPAPLEEGPRPSFSAEDTRAMFPPCRGDAGTDSPCQHGASRSRWQGR
eukprot:1726154-Rhodomonas_salina.1